MTNNKGFSLIEVLVTMLIVTVGMLALGSFYLAAIQSEGRAQERVAAIHFAEQILEEWQVKTTAATPAPSITPDCKIAGANSGPLGIGSVKADCVPNAGLPIPFSILIDESNATAPIPNGHKSHSNYGTPTAAPEIGNLLTDITNTTKTVKIRSVKVSWTVGTVTRDVVLTHITKKF